MSAAISGRDPRATTPVSDLSETGVFVHTDDPLPIGSPIELKFRAVPQHDEPVLFEGRGRVVRHAVEGEPPGMGVEFVDLGEAARDVVRKLLLTHVADQGSRPLGQNDHELVDKLLSSKP